MHWFKKDKKENDIIQLIMPSVIGMLVCCACLAGTTLAWYNVAVSSSTETITAAHFKAEVSVVEKETNSQKIVNGNIYNLTGGKEYLISVSADGTAQQGYVRLITEHGTKFTGIIKKGEVFIFSFTPESDTTVVFESAWGAYDGPVDFPTVNQQEQ